MCVRACVRACVCACVRACARVCVRVRVCVLSRLTRHEWLLFIKAKVQDIDFVDSYVGISVLMF